MVKSEEEGLVNPGKVNPTPMLLDLQRQFQRTPDNTNQGAKRPADPNPTTNPPPPAKCASTNSALELQISELPGAVRDQVHEEFHEQLPDLLRDLLPKALGDQAPKSERPRKIEEEARQLREETRQLREAREKDKAAHKELEDAFEGFRGSVKKTFEVFMKKTNDLTKRLEALESGKATKSAASKED